jgi:peptide/nickel transport system permease protein
MRPDPESARQAILNARQAMQRGDRQTARKWTTRAVALDPDSEDPWLYLAAVSSPSESKQFLERALKINPGSQRARKGMIWAEERLGREKTEPPAEQGTQPIGTARLNKRQTNVSLQPAIPEPSIPPRLPGEIARRSALSAASVKMAHSKKIAGHRWTRNIKRFSSHWQNWIGFLLVSLFIIVALAAPWISPNNPKSPGPFMKVAGFRVSDLTPHPPGVGIPLGTLPGQSDVFHALVWGTRDALSFGLKVVILAAFFGMLLGAIAGYAGGFLNNILMRITDAFLAFPVIAGVVFINQLWFSAMVAAGGIFSSYRNEWLQGPASPISAILNLFKTIDPLVVVLVLFSWMAYARITNAVVASLKQAEFVQAARAIGARPSRIIFRHLLPNSLTPSIVLAARDVGAMVILQATFTFIGLGGSSVWGQVLVLGKDWVLGPGGGIFKYWWVYIPATLALVLFGIGWNLLGDGLSELLDPRDV